MSQEQQHRPQTDQEPIKYGDVFSVSGELASRPIAPQDAAMMQSAENRMLGRNLKGGPASLMKSAADQNESSGLVDHNQVTDLARDKGVTVGQQVKPGGCVVTESVAGQVVGETPTARGPFTIGDALEATAIMVGDRPVNQGDAAAIQAAEMRATGQNVLTPGGVGAAAESASSFNARMTREEDKAKLSAVLTDARKMMPGDKTVTEADAEVVRDAEARTNPNRTPYSGGVAGTMTAAAMLNQQRKNA